MFGVKDRYQKKTMASAPKSLDNPEADLRKVGYLKKLKGLKKVKKKYFVLREESVMGPARLEYYDTEKKCSSGAPPKRSIVLKTCLNISKKSDSKHKYGITLYAKEDCFHIICDAEVEQNEWLAAMIDLQNEAFRDGQTHALFEHIWQVTLKKKGLCNDKTLMSGQYRLCLTNKTLSLIRLNYIEPEIIFELECIRRFSSSDCYFIIEVGRHASTGEGELWMLVEDSVIAQNIHEVVLSSRKKNSANDPGFRPRSRSSVSDRPGSKPVSVPRGPSPAVFDPPVVTLIRSKTISEGSPRLRPGKSRIPGLSHGHSPLATSATLQHETRGRADSMDSRGTPSSLSADEQDHLTSGASSTRSTTPEGPGDQAYLDMEPAIVSKKDVRGFPEDVVTEYVEGSEYMDMAPTGGSARASSQVTPITKTTDEAYIDMSPGTPHDGSGYLRGGDVSYLDSASTSPAVSVSSSGVGDDRSGYLDMAPIGHGLPTVEEQVRMNDGGYLDMSPGSSTTSGSLTQLRPERGQSYIFDDATDGFPKRAYSVGSNPVRPKTTGHTYIDMTGGKNGNKSSSAPHLDDEEVAGVPSLHPADHSRMFMELDFFPPDHRYMFRTESGGISDIRARASSGGPLDMIRPRASSGGRVDMMRPRTSSGGRMDMMRPRKSSFNQSEFRPRAESFGRSEAGHRTSSSGRHQHSGEPHRQRTATIGNDFRPRNSSFGAAGMEMRPRASSYGNQYKRYRKPKNLLQDLQKQHSRNSSQESLKRTSGRTSQESLQSHTSTEYMDMQGGANKLSSSPSHTGGILHSGRHGSAEVKRGSTTLQVSSGKNDENYMTLDFGGEKTSSTISTSRRQSSGSSPSVEERRRMTLERLEKGSVTSGAGAAEHKPSASSTSSKSRLKQLGTKFNAKFHLKISSTGDGCKSSSESLSSEQTAAAGAKNAKGRPGTPGEYIDINFEKQRKETSVEGGPTAATSTAVATVKSANASELGARTHPAPSQLQGVPSNTADSCSRPFVVQHEYEEVDYGGEHYAMMSPTDSNSSTPKLSSGGTERPFQSDFPDPCPVVSTADLISSIKSDVAESESGEAHSPRHATAMAGVSSHPDQSSQLTPVVAVTSSEESNYLNLDLSGSGSNSGPSSSKRMRESNSPSRSSASGSRQKVQSKVDQSSAGSSSSRKLSSSPLASFLHNLAQGRKSPKAGQRKGGGSPKASTADEPSALVAPDSPKANRRSSDSPSPNPPAQFTKTPPLSIRTVKPDAASLQIASAREGAFRKSPSRQLSADASAPSSTQMRTIRSTGSLTAMDVTLGSATKTSPQSKLRVTSPKILQTSSELISEISADGRCRPGGRTSRSTSSSGSDAPLSAEPGGAYENMSFERKTARQTSQTSVGSAEPELHYASLDLSASSEDMPLVLGLDAGAGSYPQGGRSPVGKNRHSSGSGAGPVGSALGAIAGGNTAAVCGQEVPLQYAQIDFVKSESLKLQQQDGNSETSPGAEQSDVKETPPPFNVADIPLGFAATTSSKTVKTTEEPFDLA